MLLTLLTIAATAIMFVGLAFFRASIVSWIFCAIVGIFVVASQSRMTDDMLFVAYGALLLVALLLAVPFLRYTLITRPVFNTFRKVMPHISATEQEAIDAGSVWWDGELFSGRPDWQKLQGFPKAGLSPEEQAFLDNEVEQLCAMLDDWDITHNRTDLPPQVWQFIKEKGFFGMIIPREYGGLEFSAQAHSAVVSKVASRSGTAAVTVMVPNSLGPAELLLHYGSSAQKETYLRRLARGLEVPCFALTGPFAGSDAGAIPDFGVVCHDDFGGQRNVLGVRVSWEKRYITLAPAATLLGLAFKLYDPAKLLSEQVSRGITLALIPTDTPGVEIGRRHFPLNAAFLNGPTQGKQVFIPMEYIIGGEEYIGQGWRMLMECLAAGRSISLPASSIGGMKLAARTCGAYGRVRKQFKTSIGKFEGVEEALARIGGHTYMVDAGRRLTALALDLGEKPSVISAIIKYHATERGRVVMNDAMDIHGGKGIILGPSNYLARFYQQIPIGITVEGANILTRSLMIFGQGAIRCHPYILREIATVQQQDYQRALYLFDEALREHISFAVSNAARSFVYGIVNGRGAAVPALHKITKRYYQQLTRWSAAFAFATDMALAVMGGSLKRKEKLSARLGDVLSQLYLCSAALKRFEDDGQPKEDLPLLEWALQDAIYQMQQAMLQFIDNFPARLLARLMKLVIFPMGPNLQPPSDALGHKVAALMMRPGETRERLTQGMFMPRSEHDAVAILEAAFASSINTETLQTELAAAYKSGKLTKLDEMQRIIEAYEKQLISRDQAALLERDYQLRRAAIMVDDFTPEELRRN